MRHSIIAGFVFLFSTAFGEETGKFNEEYYRGFAQGAYYGLMLEGVPYDIAWCMKYELEAQGSSLGSGGEFQEKLEQTRATCSDRVAAEQPGYASFARTTLLARKSELAESITFWRDVMGFEYAGDPQPRTGSGNPHLGWSEKATTYFTAFNSKEGSTLALLLVEDEPGFPSLELPEQGVSYGGMVLVHTAKQIRDIYDRAVEFDVDIIKPYGPSPSGRSIQMMFRAPTGQIVEIYELIDQN